MRKIWQRLISEFLSPTSLIGQLVQIDEVPQKSYSSVSRERIELKVGRRILGTNRQKLAGPDF